jgi:hypothetical protein
MEVVSISTSYDSITDIVVQMPHVFYSYCCCSHGAYQHIPVKLLHLLPGLNNHDCHNEQNLPFNKDIFQTELPHVLEHTIIELLYLVSLGTGKVYGKTLWDWDKSPAGLFYIKIFYPSEQLCRAAINTSVHLINSIAEAVPFSLPEKIEHLRYIAESHPPDRCKIKRKSALCQLISQLESEERPLHSLLHNIRQELALQE